MDFSGARHLATLCAALQLGLAAPAHAQVQKSDAQLYYDCVLDAGQRLASSKEAADVVAEAALGDPKCSFHLIMVRLDRGGEILARQLQSQARQSIISAVVNQRIQKPKK
jgi:hypothetical protein